MESQPAAAKPPSALAGGTGDVGEGASEGGNPGLVAASKSWPRSTTRQPTEPNRTPLYVDETLPPGWRRKVCRRKSGNSAGRYEVFILGPTGKRFRSRNQLRIFFSETGETGLDPDDFDFSTFGRNNL
jgi:methyl CpG binding protein 2